MKTTLYRYPTVGELRVLEIAARRERAREVARLLRAGARKLISLAEQLTAAHGGGRIRHA
jgi:hypothetical protein